MRSFMAEANVDADPALIHRVHEVDSTPQVKHPHELERPRKANGERKDGKNRKDGRTQISIRSERAKSGDSEGETTLGTRKLRPTKRKVCGTTRGTLPLVPSPGGDARCRAS
jgi:hypothetical protein